MKTEVRFYHLTRSTLEQTLPSILEKVLERQWRAVVRTSSSERVTAISESLWTHKEDSFLPHGTAHEGNPAEQPIWITDADENPNQAHALFLTDGLVSTTQQAELICLIFDDSNPETMAATRAAWSDYKNAGHTLTYWQQTDKGWERKNG